MFIKTHEIIDAFCKMDIERLDVLLDDDRIYQEVRKPVFLKKLRSVFNKLGAEGEKRLEMYGGECGECNIGCRGYMFKSPISGKNISFIFEETKDGEDIEDIYDCPQFKTNDATISHDKKVNLFIGFDEKANFRPSEDYLEKMEQCQSAVAELTNGGNDEVIISKDGMLQWLEKYKFVRASFELPPFNCETFNIFYWLYSDIKNAVEYLRQEDEALKAICEINIHGDNDDDQLLEWLMKYEALGSELSSFYYQYFEEPDPDPIPEFIIPSWKYPLLKIPSQEFKSILEFVPFFNENYDKMRLKFGSDPAEDANYPYSGEGMSEDEKNRRSLTYVVNERRKVKG